jgi:AcrR family transcriptional regulator
MAPPARKHPSPKTAAPKKPRARGRRTGIRNNEAGHETRARLLDSAEQLFAERGLDAVSGRDITELADANPAAIHYHFGSKQDLIAAILERRAAAVGRRREELLDGLDARLDAGSNGEPVLGLRDVVEALVQPTAELVAEGAGGRNYVAFLAALGSHAELVALVMDVYDPYTEHCLRTLARVTPDLPDDVRILRFAVGKDLVNRVLGLPNGQVQLWVERQRPGTGAAVAASLVDMLVGIFEAPVTLPAGRPLTRAGAGGARPRRGGAPAPGPRTPPATSR